MDYIFFWRKRETFSNPNSVMLSRISDSLVALHYSLKELHSIIRVRHSYIKEDITHGDTRELTNNLENDMNRIDRLMDYLVYGYKIFNVSQEPPVKDWWHKSHT